MIKALILILSLLFLLNSCEQIKYSQGERIYLAKCANCHMDDGNGLKKLIPAISKSDYIIGNKPSKITCLIHNGINADSLGFKEKYMPSAKKMKDVELTNLLNFLQEKFNESKHEYKLQEVKAYRKNCI